MPNSNGRTQRTRNRRKNIENKCICSCVQKSTYRLLFIAGENSLKRTRVDQFGSATSLVEFISDPVFAARSSYLTKTDSSNCVNTGDSSFLWRAGLLNGIGPTFESRAGSKYVFESRTGSVVGLWSN